MTLPDLTTLTHQRLFLGIDVGGTNVKLGLVDGAGTIHWRDSFATVLLRTPERIFQRAIELAEIWLNRAPSAIDHLSAVGVAVPGVLDSRESVLREVVNMPGWLDQPLMQILSQVTRRPSVILNDACAAAYAEYRLRELDQQSLALVTLGTGIGGGVVVAGDPWGGDHGCAGELGHITIDFTADALPCTCGSRGHLETYAGSSGVVQRLRNAIACSPVTDHPPSILSENVSPRDIADTAEIGNPICQNVIDETARCIGQAIGLMGQVLDPSVVLIGGAMNFGGMQTATGRRFLEHIRKRIRETTLVQVGNRMVVEFATLGNDAGIVGAAMAAKQFIEESDSFHSTAS
jgi:glucokinase